MAASLCQRGLYHRSDDSIENGQVGRVKAHLFWQVYTLDKCLSLRLGRGSVIQNWDVNINNPPMSGLGCSNHLEQVSLPRIWVTTSSLRARVHEQM